ncbi:cation:dicarboxylase symporter family transporter [Clostridium tyrobutyricum]|jgi:proton glutamate symport protein|uniref:Proton/glutamate symport protein @ Sodium/glutamate symport protein n=1 Tax=Clostridium tyrobutyricum DIVETGP TaxID=1408889 RepID=W6N5I4_CLOTY|nr:cation:dicarboxylase symporter family transporter [Clostridium tyrobutyricum]AND84785.1 proton/sodium-glutamate symport protein [Clostridium tyrobutyricum]ANP69373.1 glutamate:protein symporter [Clostridium tyrobutyricum]MBR9647673.1 cation:dicarboxylase symporter family transporter [Clostridium tyrobutyricum]MBV4415967.1 cation:dicarboxylase symporter family transporter [Clostridium tyrobutyricum]MBV4422091.1 cation:dicarboxylase symporter family transporter [Clostridium tyrobutyricum]
MKKIKFGLATKIIIGLVLGIIVGAVFYGNPNVSTYLQPIGDIFLRLIKMIVIPIVFSCLVVGVAGVGDMKQLGKLGVKSIVYFEIMSTIAIIVGLLIANIFHPGTGINMNGLSKSNISGFVNTAKTVSHNGFKDTIVGIVPDNLFTSLSNGDMLPIIFFAVIFGLGVAAIGEKGKPILKLAEGISEAMFWVTNQIMKTAPIGVFALIGVTVSKFGLQSLIPLGKLVITVYGSMILFVIIIMGIVAKLFGNNIIHIIKVLKDELILAYTTSSSETVLPRIMTKMEKYGCPSSIASFVVPTGYSFNLDGSTLYEAIAALFIAQMYGIHLSLFAQINLVIVLMITSKGIAGVPGVSFVVLLATLGSIGIPVEGLAFIAGIDRILDMARTAVNVVGNSLAVVVVSKWEGIYDDEKGRKYLKSLSEQKTEYVVGQE